MTGQVLYQINSFASSPFAITEIPDLDLIDRVCEEIQKDDYQSSVSRDSFDNNFDSVNLWNTTNETLRELMDLYIAPTMISYLQCVSDTTTVQNYKFESFANIFTQGKTIGFHNHDFALAVSCVYLTDVTDGNIRLFTPLKHALHAWNNLKGIRDYKLSHAFHPRKGNMILFPAWLDHEVEWYEPSQTRINICTNLGAK